MTKEKRALIIFTRNPELGKCKTRLAKTIGDEAALAIYKYLLKHTSNMAERVNADRYVFYSENIIEDDIWKPEHFRKKIQQGEDLGERMYNAFEELLNLGYKKVCIIGSDLLDLDSQLIENAYDKLNESDAVIGPSEDGGYYLLATKNLYPEIFKNKVWGTESVLASTIKDLHSHKVHLLKTLNDIDTFEDTKVYEELKPYFE
ncbi:MAG: TIGR04282 family arsenosugar biosynthesis glycosyltransferase [Bacteroidota bacterium]